MIVRLLASLIFGLAAAVFWFLVSVVFLQGIILSPLLLIVSLWSSVTAFVSSPYIETHASSQSSLMQAAISGIVVTFIACSTLAILIAFTVKVQEWYNGTTSWLSPLAVLIVAGLMFIVIGIPTGAIAGVVFSWFVRKFSLTST